jgi:hypothetical protein
MTVILQDVSMILALPIRGQPVCVSSDSTDWREHMTHMIGTAPTKEGVSAGASYPWLQENFNKCPDDASDEVIQRYARAYLWYVISHVLFSDADGWRVVDDDYGQTVGKLQAESMMSIAASLFPQ